MEFIQVPNLPDAPAAAVLMDGRIGEKIEKSLTEAGILVLKTAAHTGIYEAVCFHPDMLLHHLGCNDMVYAPGTDGVLLDALAKLGFRLIPGLSRLSSKYPFNIAYNVARVGNLAFHNEKFTDPVLKMELDKRGVEFVDVKQGYSKCSISVVSQNAIITSDCGIERAAVKKGLDVLLLPPEEGIRLPGLDYGFIGGSTGMLDKRLWAITGDAQNLKSFYKIHDFLTAKEVKIISLSDEYIVDVGSIIPLLTKSRIIL